MKHLDNPPKLRYGARLLTHLDTVRPSPQIVLPEPVLVDSKANELPLELLAKK